MLSFSRSQSYFWFTGMTSYRSGSQYLQLIHQILNWQTDNLNHTILTVLVEKKRSSSEHCNLFQTMLASSKTEMKAIQIIFQCLKIITSWCAHLSKKHPGWIGQSFTGCCVTKTCGSSRSFLRSTTFIEDCWASVFSDLKRPKSSFISLLVNTLFPLKKIL